MATSTTPPRKSPSDNSIIAVPFSYAQAAKGMASSTTSLCHSSKTPSGTSTPSKDSASIVPVIPTLPTRMSWADEDDHAGNPNETDPGKPTACAESHVGSTAQSPPQSGDFRSGSLSGLSSPEFGTSASSTLGKEDDISSIPNASSESTWENKSQASNGTDKLGEHGETVTEKGKRKDTEKEKMTFKMLQEAPIPTVNIWKQRAEEAKAKAALQSNMARSTAATPTPGSVNGISKTAQEKSNETVKAEAKRRSKVSPGSSEHINCRATGKGTSQNSDMEKGRDEDKPAQRREIKSESEHERRRNLLTVKEVKGIARVPLTPHHDEASWPTPESAQDEERKKALEKVEKVDKERTATNVSRPHGKNEWVPVPYTPSVVFNTPIPNSSSRRGGRSGGRGTREGGGRGGPYVANGTSAGDKDGSALTSSTNGETGKRGKLETSNVQESSPSKAGRSFVSESSSKENRTSSISVDLTQRPDPANEGDHLQAGSSTQDEGATSQSTNSNITSFPKHTSRQKQSRKFDNSTIGERRKESDPASPTTESNLLNNRRSSAATQTDDIPEKRLNHATENSAPANKPTPSDRRGNSFGSFSTRERGENRGRNGIRGGRSSGFQSTHHVNGHQFANGHVQTLQSPPSFPLPRSPTTYQDQQGLYFSSPQQGRGYRSSGPRSQSIASDTVYGRVPGSYSGSHPAPISPIQTFVPGLYDYSVMAPMSAIPYSPYMNSFTLMGMVSMQLEYYFSVDNLCKDLFLRKHMDSQGFVFLRVVADFNRIKQLTADLDLIKLCCQNSSVIEYKIGSHDKVDRIRKLEGWEQWVLNTQDRDSSAQNDGPAELEEPIVSNSQFYETHFPIRYTAVATGSPSTLNSTNDTSFQSLNGVAASPTAGLANSNHDIPNGANSEISVPSAAPPSTVTTSPIPIPLSDQNLDEVDSYLDEQIESLSIIVRKQEATLQQPSSHPVASRTFSNGSIDIKGIADEQPKSDEHFSPQVNGCGIPQGEEGQQSQSCAKMASSASSTTDPVRLFWIKDMETPVGSLPKDSTCELYAHLRSKALEQRHAAVKGSCPYNMDVLYQFWSHFLIRNFNTRMYDEFRSLAFEDASQRDSEVGLENLRKYYGEALTSQSMIRDRVARHYVELVKSESFKSLDQPCVTFKQLRSAWRNGALNLKNRKKISVFVDSELRAALEQ